jgi:hypothetical protein
MQAVEPTDDTFVRQQAPTFDYGGAGALAVSGQSAVNAFGVQNGRFDTAMKFNTAGTVQTFNSAFGVGGWTISSVEVSLHEVPSPNNPVFNIGVGTFEIHWLSADNWTEGNGTPGFLEIGTGDQLTWNYLQTLLASATENSLGSFSNTLTDVTHVYALMPDPVFIADIAAGGSVTLHLVPVSATLGFTFHSKDYFIPQYHPRLTITAVPTGAQSADLDGDGDVDLADYNILRNCLAGPAADVPSGCAATDLNNDGHVDLLDFAQFADSFTGP